jgi:hypothetical protein
MRQREYTIQGLRAFVWVVQNTTYHVTIIIHIFEYLFFIHYHLLQAFSEENLKKLFGILIDLIHKYIV